MGEQLAEHEHRVTALELLFDLVFVFAFTQVTTLLSDQPTWGGLGRGLLVLAVLWWAWASYAWLTNVLDADQGPVLAALLVVVAAMFVSALAVPAAFGRHRYVFAVAFLVAPLMHLALFGFGVRRSRDFLGAILRLAPAHRPGP